MRQPGKPLDISAADAEAMGVRFQDGYAGMFTRQQSPLAAIPNGARVVKTDTEKGDAHRPGERGTVLGSVGDPIIGVGYFVEWDSTPRAAVFVMAAKIERSSR